MLELKGITKSYTTGDFRQEALANVSLAFRKSEFVAILGQSGSGKTTLLNIIGGLDRYDSGDLIINGKSTKAFKPTEWDAYRNNSVGFIFQSYNLIGHISVLANIEMGMTLSGVPQAQRRQKALEALERVGLRNHAKKRPNQLSGGQMQRVAIARALVNNPDIILADEPTGALDSETSVQIMDLIQEIAQDKLVIMVTHNPDLAKKYATRIVELQDGRVVSDSNPVENEPLKHDYALKKTSMHFGTALKLSFHNIMTKKGRTIITAFASSIGIIGIALIMALSNGFDKKVNEYEAGALAEYPIIISQQAMEMTQEAMDAMREQMQDNMGLNNEDAFPEEQTVYSYDKEANQLVHTNQLSDAYVDYLETLDSSLVSGIAYTRITQMNLMRDGQLLNSENLSLTALPKKLSEGTGIIENNYDILAGHYPENRNEVVLVVDKNNRVDQKTLQALGFTGEEIAFSDILGTTMKLVMNDDYYVSMGDYFLPNTDLDAMYASENNVTLTIVGILRIQSGSQLTILSEGIAYPAELSDYYIDNASQSAVVKKQQEANYNVLSGQPFDEDAQKEQILSYLGANGTPYAIMLFPIDFDAKDAILAHLDAYNEGKEAEETIVYTDLAAILTDLSGSIMDAITIVLIAFSAISLIVSVIMIGVITYTSVMERTKEIGILRALGARKKDITRVFNAETFIIGLCSGLLGIFIAWLLTFPANSIIENMSGLPGVAQMDPLQMLLLICVSLALTVLGGFIPAKLASKKDPVAALRTE